MTPESITPLEKHKPNLLLISFSFIQFNILTVLLSFINVKEFIVIFAESEHTKIPRIIYGVPLTFSPAACGTIERFFSEGNRNPDDYDVIMTGDLGFVGLDILRELLSRDSIDCGERLTDGGMLIYDREAQDVHAGGSGCGCSASVLCGYFLPRLLSGEINKMLFIATGALLSPTSSYQGEAIPAVAHAIEFSVL